MPVSETQADPLILIVSNDSVAADRFSSILADGFSVSVSDSATAATAFIQQHFPQLIMIDPLLLKDQIKSVISEISAASPLSRIVIIEDDAARSVDQMALFKTGAHGFFAHDISATLLVKAISSIAKGEVWVPRKLIATLISDLARGKAASEARQDPAARESMAKLTPRELEVAQMVHSGGNNKMIARELEISERTVKAHLSAIFRKLNIANRLHLALFFNEIT